MSLSSRKGPVLAKKNPPLKELKMPADTLYTWVSRSRMGNLPELKTPIEPQNALKMAEQIKQLEQENRALKSELLEKKKWIYSKEQPLFSQVARRNR